MYPASVLLPPADSQRGERRTHAGA